MHSGPARNRVWAPAAPSSALTAAHATTPRATRCTSHEGAPAVRARGRVGGRLLAQVPAPRPSVWPAVGRMDLPAAHAAAPRVVVAQVKARPCESCGAAVYDLANDRTHKLAPIDAMPVVHGGNVR